MQSKCFNDGPLSCMFSFIKHVYNLNTYVFILKFKIIIKEKLKISDLTKGGNFTLKQIGAIFVIVLSPVLSFLNLSIVVRSKNNFYYHFM